ncbi:MAG: Ig-like domain-containing domain [Bacteroidota bacterium]
MIKKYLSLLVVLIVIYACATVQSPTGGEKDEKAPILYESNPKNQSTNFKGKEIKLFFNEWMKLEQINKELIITPREDFEYEATLKKQELIIELEEPLKDSTTYTFNFRKALSDITEGNLWENPIIAFSTGDYLDSLKVEGNVEDLMSQEPAKSYIVGLYDANIDTANLREGKPVYFTTTNDEGDFKMQNIKSGRYLLYAFKDSNDNLINDSHLESYGFYADTLNLNDSIPPLSILTYKRNEDTLKLKKFSPVGKDFIIQYNKGLTQYQVTNPKDSNQHIYTNDVEESKYLKIYKENFPDLEYETDSVELFISITDSINQTRLDTVNFKLRESRITNDKIKIASKPNGKIISGEQEFIFKLTKPVHEFNYDSIQLRIDTIQIKTFTQEEIETNFNKKEIQLKTVINKDQISTIYDSLKSRSDSIQHYNDSINNINDSSNVNLDSTELSNDSTETNIDSTNINTKDSVVQQKGIERKANSISKEGNVSRGDNNQNSGDIPLEIYVGQGAFMGIESDSSDKSSTKISFKKVEDYGTIKGKVNNMESEFVIELLSKNYEVKDTLINKNEYQFNYVEPGEYRIRIIEDKNGNHKWDAGNPLILKAAENIYYLDEVITVKANWEIIDKNFEFDVDKDVNEGEETEDL